jgi:voltage-gated potassium channel
MRLSRERVWEIVEVARPGDKASRRFDMFILALIGLNVVAVMLQSVEAIQNRFAWPFFLFELVSVIVFSIEYLARLWASVENPDYSRPILGRMRFAVRPLVLIDLLAIAPFLVSFANVDFRIMRAARLFRLVRLQSTQSTQ